MDTETYYQEYSDIVVNRKRKNRKKGNRKLKLDTNASNDSSRSDDLNNAESTVESNCTDNDDDEVTNCDRVKDRVSVDAMMKAPPKYSHNEVDRREVNGLTMSSKPLSETESVDPKSPLQSDVVDRQMEENDVKLIQLQVPNIVKTFENDYKVATPQTGGMETVYYNRRALSKDSATYELEKFEKNALIIFNQENIEGHKRRLGTERDVKALMTTFTNYGFEVIEHKDLTKDDLFKELKACK